MDIVRLPLSNVHVHTLEILALGSRYSMAVLVNLTPPRAVKAEYSAERELYLQGEVVTKDFESRIGMARPRPRETYMIIRYHLLGWMAGKVWHPKHDLRGLDVHCSYPVLGHMNQLSSFAEVGIS
jgi:hypothetical protein